MNIIIQPSKDYMKIITNAIYFFVGSTVNLARHLSCK